jgi:hypothetical protein
MVNLKRENVLAALPAAICAFAVAGCGSSHHSSHATASSYSKLVKYSDCMRSHGVSNFPDPEDGGYPLRTSGINMQAPVFQSATKACAKLQPGGAKEPAPITSGQVYQMAKKARCIRKHGFPNFPDPTLASGGHLFANSPGAGWNPEAPAAITARKACANVGIAIPGWGVAWFGTT